MGISRRDVLKNLAIGAAAGSVLQVIPAEAAALARQMVQKEKAASPAGKYTPKYYLPHQYETLVFLCDTIIPKDEKSGGAVEAGAPEFIDLLTSENEEFQLMFGGAASCRPIRQPTTPAISSDAAATPSRCTLRISGLLRVP